MDERRKTPRHRTLKAGSIALAGEARLDCQVRNLSPIGAMLEVASQIGVPNDFVLVVESEHLKEPCHVVWRIANRIGVEFT